MGVEYNLISTDAQRALEEFSEDFALALAQGGVQQWAKELGLYHESRALKTTFPIPISAAGYKEFKGDVLYRTIFEKSIELKPKTWQDGVSELASVIEAPDFIGWTSEPAAMATAAQSLANEIIAERIEANPKCFDDKAFFATDHPVNVLKSSAGKFSNLHVGAGTEPSHANLSVAKTAFRRINGANDKPLGLRMTHVLVHASKEEVWRDLLEKDLLIETVGTSFGATNNRHKGTVQLIVCDELTDEDAWYPLALGKPGLHPWVVQDEGAPESILSDKDSHLYKTKLKVGIAYILRGNGELALPHAMQKWEGRV